MIEQEQAGDLTKVPLHAADLGTDTINAELDASNATRESAVLADIDAALERLYETPEKFGLDERTHAPISARASRGHSLGAYRDGRAPVAAMVAVRTPRPT